MNMNYRTVKIVFKDNTHTTYEIKDTWLGDNDIANDIKHTMALKLPYILNFNNVNDNDDTLIIPTENIKYIRIINKPDKVKKEHNNEN